MIITVTLNPALDVTYRVARLEPHTSHRVGFAVRRAGGKGVNVARVLHQLGHRSRALALVGGTSGARLRAELLDAGIGHHLVELTRGETRQTVTIVDDASGDATVLLEEGPRVAAADWAAFRAAYDDLVGPDDVVVLSGSLPPGLADDAYADLCARTTATCLVDTGGRALRAAASAGAAALLPNRDELAAATGLADPVAGARQLLAAGAGAVVVSLGAAGLVAVTGSDAWRVRPVERLHGNPTGAGDALAAALAATVDEPWPVRLREALAWSAGAVPMPLAGEVDLATVARVREAAVVESMEEESCP